MNADIAMLAGWIALTAMCTLLQYCITAHKQRLPGTQRPPRPAKHGALVSPYEGPALYGAGVLAYRPPFGSGGKGRPESTRELRALHAQYAAVNDDGTAVNEPFF